MCSTAQRKHSNFRELRIGEVRRTPLLKLSEKGSERRSEGGFGRYEEGEMGRKGLPGGPWGYATDAPEAFRTVSLGTLVNRAFEDAGDFVGWHPVRTCDNPPGKERTDVG
jgi:hypothetical protein